MYLCLNVMKERSDDARNRGSCCPQRVEDPFCLVEVPHWRHMYSLSTFGGEVVERSVPSSLSVPTVFLCAQYADRLEGS